MSITTVGLQLEVMTGSIRKVTQDIHQQDLLSKDEDTIRYSEWKWVDTHLAVQEMLIQHLRKRIANKCDIEYQATGLVREGNLSRRKSEIKPSAQRCDAPRKAPSMTRHYKKSGIDVSINLDIKRNTGDNR